jgi:hypothetical protein
VSLRSLLARFTGKSSSMRRADCGSRWTTARTNCGATFTNSGHRTCLPCLRRRAFPGALRRRFYREPSRRSRLPCAKAVLRKLSLPILRRLIPFDGVRESSSGRRPEADAARLYWFADKHYLGVVPSGQPLDWTATPGVYRLTALDDHGRVATGKAVIASPLPGNP